MDEFIESDISFSELLWMFENILARAEDLDQESEIPELLFLLQSECALPPWEERAWNVSDFKFNQVILPLD